MNILKMETLRRAAAKTAVLVLGGAPPVLRWAGMFGL
jgi:hypothetical protein